MDGGGSTLSESQSARQQRYTLSAEAQEFVPSHDPANLPKYMFNCYPFVNENAAMAYHGAKGSHQ